MLFVKRSWFASRPLHLALASCLVNGWREVKPETAEGKGAEKGKGKDAKGKGKGGVPPHVQAALENKVAKHQPEVPCTHKQRA